MTEEKKKETKEEKKEESPREESKEMKDKDPATEEEETESSEKAEDTKADESSKPKGEEEEADEETSGAEEEEEEPDEEDDAEDEEPEEQEDEEEEDEEDEDEEGEDEEPSRASRQEANDRDKGRRLSFGLNTVIFAALVIVGLVLVNVVSSRVYERADLPDDGLYSLSDSSKKLVKKLPRDLKVKLFVSKELLPGYTSTARYVKDLLDEYKNASNGRFKWEIIHPELDEKYKKEAERYGVKSFVARAKSANALEAKTITFGMVIEYNKPDSGDSVEVLPRLFPGIERNIEYLITERIKRLTVKRKKILFVSGHGEFPARAQEKVKGFLQGMFNQYEVVIGQVNKKVAKDVDILVLMTPKKPFTPAEVKHVDEFLMRGDKGALFLVDGMVRRQQQRMMPNQRMPNIFMAAQTGLENLLDNWGVKINANIIMDQQLQLFPTKRGMIFHPAIPAVRIPGLKKTVTPFLISSLKVDRVYLGERAKGKPFVILPIMASSSKSWSQKPPFIFDLKRKPRPPSGVKTKAFILGALIEGRLPSVESKEGQQPKRAKSKVRVAVIGDADMLWLSRQMRGNAIFLQNVMDRLAQDEVLIKLRNKTAQDRALSLPDSRTKILGIKLANMLGLPLLVILMGIVFSLIRRARRRRSQI